MKAPRLGCTVAMLVWTIRLAGAAQEAEPPATAPRISAAGQVVDSAGKPVAAARVVLREWSSIRYSDDAYQTESQDILAETTTDADGRFQFADVESRPFRIFRERAPWDIVALAKGHGLAWVHLTSADTAGHLTLKLPLSKSITGRLVDPDGQPIADCKVGVAGIAAPGSPWHTDFSDPSRLDLWRSQIVPATTTDRDGRFELGDLPADQRLTLIAQHPRFEHRHFYVATTNEPQPPVPQPGAGAGRRGEKMKSVHMPGFTEKLEPGRRISGRIVFADTDQPAADAKIHLTWQNRAFYERADDKGRFEFTSLPDSKYYLGAGTTQASYLGARVLVEFSDDAMDREITLQLPRGEPVRGEVVDADSGEGVPGVGVQYFPPEQDEQSGWSPSQAAKTDDAGRFEILVPLGSGELRVYGGLERHPTHDVPDFRRWYAKQSISPGHVAKINVLIGKALDDVRLKVAKGLVVRGRVVDPNGDSVFGVVVRAPDRFGRKENERTTVTDDEGHFELANFPRDEERQIEVEDVDRKLRGSAKVTVDKLADAGRILELDVIALGSTGKVTGTVLGDGKPLAGARVHLTAQIDRDGREEFESNGQQAETDEEGRFQFSSVAAGRRVSAYASREGYTNQGTLSYPVAAGEELEFPAIELKSRGAFVEGIVVDLDGKPVAGVTVSAWERENRGASVSYGRSGAPPPTDENGRFRINDLPNVPLKLMAQIRPPEPRKDRSVRFPAWVNAEPNQTDVRIVLDPKLQRPLP